jgi:hypothetical protein
MRQLVDTIKQQSSSGNNQSSIAAAGGASSALLSLLSAPSTGEKASSSGCDSLQSALAGFMGGAAQSETLRAAVTVNQQADGNTGTIVRTGPGLFTRTVFSAVEAGTLGNGECLTWGRKVVLTCLQTRSAYTQ